MILSEMAFVLGNSKNAEKARVNAFFVMFWWISKRPINKVRFPSAAFTQGMSRANRRKRALGNLSLLKDFQVLFFFDLYGDARDHVQLCCTKVHGSCLARKLVLKRKLDARDGQRSCESARFMCNLHNRRK